VLDGGHDQGDDDGSARVRNQQAGLGSDGGSYRSDPSYEPLDRDEP
jgi:hypothetical protein